MVLIKAQQVIFHEGKEDTPPSIILDIKSKECYRMQREYTDEQLKQVGWKWRELRTYEIESGSGVCSGPWNLITTEPISNYHVGIGHSIPKEECGLGEPHNLTVFEFNKNKRRSPAIQFFVGDDMDCQLGRTTFAGNKYFVACGSGRNDLSWID